MEDEPRPRWTPWLVWLALTCLVEALVTVLAREVTPWERTRAHVGVTVACAAWSAVGSAQLQAHGEAGRGSSGNLAAEVERWGKWGAVGVLGAMALVDASSGVVKTEEARRTVRVLVAVVAFYAVLFREWWVPAMVSASVTSNGDGGRGASPPTTATRDREESWVMVDAPSAPPATGPVPPATTATTSQAQPPPPPSEPQPQTKESVIVASHGNGEDHDVSPEQLRLCARLRDDVLQEQRPAWAAKGYASVLDDYVDAEACRRFLVARGWSYKKAKAQLTGTLAWRLQDEPWARKLTESPACVRYGPQALVMRVVGLDKEKRPVLYMSFGHATHRFNALDNVWHICALLEAAERVINAQFREQLTTGAAQMQWVWVVDFVGFGVFDQDPRSAVYVGQLMARYPERLHAVFLVNAPGLFSATWKMLNSILDERVRRKVVFTRADSVVEQAQERLGTDMAQWLEAELRQQRAYGPAERPYWKPHPDEPSHDPRGLKSYVGSRWYIETPGDAFEKEVSSRPPPVA